MTEQDKPKLITFISDLWDSWDRGNRTKNVETCDMFMTWELPDIEQAIREARQQRKPGEIILDTLLRAQSILRSVSRAPRTAWLEERLEEHRQHYAGNKASGLKWPGDDEVRRMILAGEKTPMQVYTARRLVALCRARKSNE